MVYALFIAIKKQCFNVCMYANSLIGFYNFYIQMDLIKLTLRPFLLNFLFL